MKPTLKRKYGVIVDNSTHKTIKRPCFILCNHQAAFDQFTVGIAFKFGINYVASDTIFRHGLQSWLMKKLVKPIPITKGQSDMQAVKKMMEAIKNGGAVGIFPEGNRCFFGETMNIGQGTGRLAKMLKVPLVLMRMQGGYLAKPRWKIKPNKGRVTAGVVRVIGIEELAAMTNEQVQEIIDRELYQNDFEWNTAERIKFLGKARAEHLESILFYCPRCETVGSLVSKVHDFYCSSCDLRTSIDEYGFFEQNTNCKGDSCVSLCSSQDDNISVLSAYSLPATILEWSKLQLQFIKNSDYSSYNDKPIFCDNDILLSKAIKAKKQLDTKKGDIAIYNDRFEIAGTTIMLRDVKNLSIQEVRKLSIYTTKDTYVIDVPLKRNLVKYMILGYHLKNLSEGIQEGYYGY